MRQLDPLDVLRRGHRDIASLSDDETLVFAVMELEAMSMMEGWDHFFTHSEAFGAYGLMKAGLAAAGDHESVAILRSYESWLASAGVAMTPEEIDAHVGTLSEEELDQLPDWRAEFDAVIETRWELITGYLRRRGVLLA